MTRPPASLHAGETLTIEGRLDAHLRAWLGQWDLPLSGTAGVGDADVEVTVIGSPARTRPGWDGNVQALVGVAAPWGGVLSVPPEQVGAVRALGGGRPTIRLSALARGLPTAIGRPEGRFGLGLFRWAGVPADLPDAGEWVARTDPRVPEWLQPFNGDVLVAWDEDGRYAAGVGRKMHDAFGHELAVVTDEAHRGRGIATRLVAQAARRVLADGAVPTYLHAPDNLASAHVADASGFPDRGWRVIGVWG